MLDSGPLNLTEHTGAVTANVILIADLFYHRTASVALVAFLRQQQKKVTEVIIADGNRPFTPATGITVITQETVPVSMELEGVPHREVRLLALENN